MYFSIDQQQVQHDEYRVQYLIYTSKTDMTTIIGSKI